MTSGVLTRSYSNDRSGVNSQETILTAPAVAKRGIKRLYELAIPDDARGAEAQVLCAPRVQLSNGQVRDLIIVASLANRVHAFDHATGKKVWTCSLGRPIDGSRAIDSWGINDHWGILSTPVIDHATQMLYACSWSSPDGTKEKARHYIEAISLVSGSRVRQPLDLEGAIYDPGGVPVQKFASAARKQRASLLLLGQTVFVAFGSIFESAASNRGWVLAFDIRRWMCTAAWCTAVKGSGGGIWQAGAGLAADANGDIILMTGNGDFDGETDWGECFIKLRYTPPGGALRGELKVVDHWSPFLDSVRVAPGKTVSVVASSALMERSEKPPTNRRRYAMVTADRMDAATGNIPLSFGEADDMDLGSGGPVVIDELDLVLGAGKDGILYAVRLNAMGGTTLKMLSSLQGVEANYRESLACLPMWFTFFPGWSVSPMPSDIRDLNFLFGGKTHHQHGSPIVWKGPQGWRMLCWGENSTLRMWSIEALPSPSPTIPNVKISFLATGEEFASPHAPVPPGGMPGGMMCLSCDPSGGGAVLWATIPYLDANQVVSPGRLLAYDLTQFKEGPHGAVIPVLWDSQQWNHEFDFVKFTPLVVWDGKVYLPSYDGRIIVYGLA